jgi:hypothetical protein
MWAERGTFRAAQRPVVFATAVDLPRVPVTLGIF